MHDVLFIRLSLINLFFDFKISNWLNGYLEKISKSGQLRERAEQMFCAEGCPEMIPTVFSQRKKFLRKMIERKR